jgi:hypothetical protein
LGCGGGVILKGVVPLFTALASPIADTHDRFDIIVIDVVLMSLLLLELMDSIFS